MTEPSSSAPARATKPARPRLSRAEESRRQILRGAFALSGVALLQPLAWIPIATARLERIRPPGALAEHAFLGACIKCGQCVQVCPVSAIRLADADDGFGVGAPYVVPREQACDFSCDALSCILACPTGALSHALGSKEQVTSGVARLARPDACLARARKPLHGRARHPEFPGLLRYEEVDRWTPQPLADHSYDRPICDVCVLECPIGERAIALVPLDDGTGAMTPEVRSDCVGCGVCEMICPADPPAIVIEARITLERAKARELDAT